MPGKNHNPSIARRILRDLKRGESPQSLIPDVNQISDPYYKALSLVYISSIGLLDGKKLTNLFKQAFSNVENVEQSWRRLELLGEMSKRLKDIKDSNLKEIQYKGSFTFETNRGSNPLMTMINNKKLVLKILPQNE